MKEFIQEDSQVSRLNDECSSTHLQNSADQGSGYATSTLGTVQQVSGNDAIKIGTAGKVKRSRGRPRKNFNTLDKVSRSSKVIKKNAKSQMSSKLEKAYASFTEQKRPEFGDLSSIAVETGQESNEDLVSLNYFLDTERFQCVIPLETYNWPDNERENQEQESLDMPFIEFTESYTLPSAIDSGATLSKSIDLKPTDFIPLESPDCQNLQIPDTPVDCQNIQTLGPIEKVYEVLRWHEEMDHLKPGKIIPAGKGIRHDLVYQFTLDAGNFLEEAAGIQIFVFTEFSPSPTQKSPLALFVQTLEKDLLRLKCQHSDLNLSIPANAPHKNVSEGTSPVYCSTPKIIHGEGMAVSELQNNHDYCNIQDERIQKIQNDWISFAQSVCGNHPEILDRQFQPYVKLEKVKMMTFTSDGHVDSFHNENSSGGDGGSSNHSYTMTSNSIGISKWSKSPNNSDQSARTGNIIKMYKCSHDCPKHIYSCGEFMPPLYSCDQRKFDFLDIVYILESLCMTFMLAEIRKAIQLEQLPTKALDFLKKESHYSSLQHSKCSRIDTQDYMPLCSEDTTCLSSSASTKNYSTSYLQRGTNSFSFEGFEEVEKCATEKKSYVCGDTVEKRHNQKGSKLCKLTKLCSFILPKQKKARKNKTCRKRKFRSISEFTEIKKKGYILRIIQGYDKRSLELQTRRRAKSKKTLKPKRRQKESHFCQLCQIAFSKRNVLLNHGSSMTHCKLVREKLATYCEVLGSIAGIEIENKEEDVTALELAEFIEEKVQVENELGVCTEDENACTFTTYIYQNPTINNISKILLEREKPTEVDHVTLSQFLDNYSPEDEDNSQEKNLSRALPSGGQCDDTSTQREGIDSTTKELRKRKRNSLSNIKANKNARGDWNIRPGGPNWLEEVQTSDLDCHKLWYLKGQRKKIEDRLGPVVHVRTFKKHTKNRNPNKIWQCFWPPPRKCLPSPGTLGSVDSGICSQATCNSPYYPHPLLHCPEELYKETGPELQQTEKGNKDAAPIKVPHELYEKHRYFRYVDLDKPTEFYYFDVSSEGDPIAVTDLPQVNDNGDDIFVFGENHTDSFSEHLQSLKAMHEETALEFEREFSSFTVTSSTRKANCGDTDSPLTTPVHTQDSQEDLFIDWTINRTETGFDSDFEHLWNNV